MTDRVEMVVVDGVRYRVEDAERLGLVANVVAPTKKAVKVTKNKARKPVDKAVEPNDEK